MFLRAAKHILLLSIAFGAGGCAAQRPQSVSVWQASTHTQYAVTSQADFATEPVRSASYTTATDSLEPRMVAAASDALIVARCDEGCQLTVGGSRVRYRVAVERVLFARPRTSIPTSIVVEGSESIDIPRGESFMSVVHKTRPEVNFDYFLTSRVAAVGVRQGDWVLYRTIEGGVLLYPLRRESWIGCFYHFPRSVNCSNVLLRSLNIGTPAQRAAYEALRDHDYAIGLFWGADIQAYPRSEFPSTPCARGQSLDVCTANQLNAFKARIDFHPGA